jgi:hypothetical protein
MALARSREIYIFITLSHLDLSQLTKIDGSDSVPIISTNKYTHGQFTFPALVSNDSEIP